MFRRNPAETYQYPGSGNTDIGAFLKTPHGQMFLRCCKLPANDFCWPRSCAFMAAFDTYAGRGQQWQADPPRLFSLRNARQFDTVWFDSVHQLAWPWRKPPRCRSESHALSEEPFLRSPATWSTAASAPPRACSVSGNPQLRQFLHDQLTAAPGTPGAWLADPVFEPTFGWQESSETMSSLAGGDLLHRRLAEAMAAPAQGAP